MKLIERPAYIKELISCMGDGLVKVVTGIRRCGKTYLLFELFRRHLLSVDVPEDHVIAVRLDTEEHAALRDPHALYEYVLSRIVDNNLHFVLIDEIQQSISDGEFRSIGRVEPRIYGVLNSFLARPNLDVYVTGSNSRFLSSDVMTQFRGRGTPVRVHPLSFSEYARASGSNPREAWDDYLVYGGMPYLVGRDDPRARERYLEGLFDGTYRRDIVERYQIRKTAEMDDLVRLVASNVGSPTSPERITATLNRGLGSSISNDTVIRYLGYLGESFVVDEVREAGAHGRDIVRSLKKYYFEDVGIRNGCLRFTHNESGHLMENVVYNELRVRGYDVGIGVVRARERVGGKQRRRSYECDFVASRGSGRAYVQCCWSVADAATLERELRPLLLIRDSFPKVIVVGDRRMRQTDESGVLVIGAIDFLLDPNSLGL